MKTILKPSDAEVRLITEMRHLNPQKSHLKMELPKCFLYDHKSKQILFFPNVVNMHIINEAKDIRATILRLLIYLLVEVFQEAIEDFQKVLDRLFISSDNIFSCKHKLSKLETVTIKPSGTQCTVFRKELNSSMLMLLTPKKTK